MIYLAQTDEGKNSKDDYDESGDEDYPEDFDENGLNGDNSEDAALDLTDINKENEDNMDEGSKHLRSPSHDSILMSLLFW